ncbi:MAG: PorT family protein [Chitinophagales bacterium]|jgi:hypothetical protein|nr:PorT family protein [Chitinophagales bacterium]
MKYFLVFLALFFFAQTKAQLNSVAATSKTTKHQIGIKTGVSIPNLSDNSGNIWSDNYTSTSGYNIGLTYEYHVSSLFSIYSELYYIKNGGKRTGDQPFTLPTIALSMFPGVTSNTIFFGNFRTELDLRYIEMPLMLRANIFRNNKDLRVYLQGGVFGGYLLQATRKTAGILDATTTADFGDGNKTPFPFLAGNDMSNSSDALGELNKWNFGLTGGLGLGYKLSKNDELSLDARVNYGFIGITANETYGKAKVGALGINAGYSRCF